MDKYQIGDFLRELRNEKDLTQEQMAEELNLNNRTISRWENGTNYPDLRMLIRLSEFLGVKVSEIIDGKREDSDMEEDINETLTQVADYTDKTKKKRKIVLASIIMFGMVCLAAELIFYVYSVPISIPIVEFISIFGVGVAFSLATSFLEENEIIKYKQKSKEGSKVKKIVYKIQILILVAWFLIALSRSILMFIR